MSEQEIEREIQERVQFKLNELLTGLKNRVAFKYGQAFDMTLKSQYIWQAFEEVNEMFKKEAILPVPYDDMGRRKKWEAKEKAVENIMKTLDFKGQHEYENKIKIIVSEIEKAQNY